MSRAVVYYAEVETAHFTFRAAGATETQARDGLMSAWRAWVRQSHADPTYVRWEDANVYKMPLGQGFQDDHKIGRPAPDKGEDEARLKKAWGQLWEYRP